MAVVIKKLVAEVPGQVTRKFDGTNTALEFDELQARHLYEELGTVIQFLNSQAQTQA